MFSFSLFFKLQTKMFVLFVVVVVTVFTIAMIMMVSTALLMMKVVALP